MLEHQVAFYTAFIVLENQVKTRTQHRLLESIRNFNSTTFPNVHQSFSQVMKMLPTLRQRTTLTEVSCHWYDTAFYPRASSLYQCPVLCNLLYTKGQVFQRNSTGKVLKGTQTTYYFWVTIAIIFGWFQLIVFMIDQFIQPFSVFIPLWVPNTWSQCCYIDCVCHTNANLIHLNANKIFQKKLYT